MVNEKKRGWKAWTDLNLTLHTVNHVTRHSVVIHHTRPASTICWKPGEWSREPRKSRIEKNSGHRSGSFAPILCARGIRERVALSFGRESFEASRIIWGPFIDEYTRKIARELHAIENEEMKVSWDKKASFLIWKF